MSVPRISRGGSIKHVRLVDFRSDTVTRPSEQMFQAMFKASTDDDVLQVDKSTRDLEEYIADLTGMEDSLFCCSGTMSNQLGLRVWLRGALQSVLLDSRSHIYKYENAGISYHSQAGTLALNPRSHGKDHLTLDMIKSRFIRPDVHCARTRVISLENTLNGALFPLVDIEMISQWARSNEIVMHLDGARLCNAAAETKIPLKEYCKHFDSVSLCLSKGIGAPIGSIIAGPRKFIEEARHFRKLFGGGWRQSGILAAAAKYGIEENFMTGKLVETHENARYLVDTLVAAVPGIKTVNRVDTNMIFLDLRNVISGKVTTVEEIVNEVHRLNEADLERGETDTKIILPTFGYSFDEGDGDFSSDDYVIRLVTHIQQDREGIDLLCNYIRKAV